MQFDVLRPEKGRYQFPTLVPWMFWRWSYKHLIPSSRPHHQQCNRRLNMDGTTPACASYALRKALLFSLVLLLVFFWHWVWHPNLEITGDDIITINFQRMALPIGGPCKMLRIIGFYISNYYLWDSDLTSPGDSQPNAIPSESCTRNLVCSYPEVNSRSLHSPVHLWLQGNRLAHVHPGDPLERKIKIK